uniref:Uncharacterized protein n=1 Tax=Caenorhabditis japonica TaxID=281687 RepID=A0A8R1IH91_CAEJA
MPAIDNCVFFFFYRRRRRRPGREEARREEEEEEEDERMGQKHKHIIKGSALHAVLDPTRPIAFSAYPHWQALNAYGDAEMQEKLFRARRA